MRALLACLIIAPTFALAAPRTGSLPEGNSPPQERQSSSSGYTDPKPVGNGVDYTQGGDSRDFDCSTAFYPEDEPRSAFFEEQ